MCALRKLRGTANRVFRSSVVKRTAAYSCILLGFTLWVIRKALFAAIVDADVWTVAITVVVVVSLAFFASLLRSLAEVGVHALVMKTTKLLLKKRGDVGREG